MWFAPRASGWDRVRGVMVCDLSFLHSYSSALILLSTECMTVYVWEYVCLLSLYYMTSPSICLDVGVWGHANPSGECQFSGYPEWPHPWKALQRDRGKYCTVRNIRSHIKAKTDLTVCRKTYWAYWGFKAVWLNYRKNYKNINCISGNTLKWLSEKINNTLTTVLK